MLSFAVKLLHSTSGVIYKLQNEAWKSLRWQIHSLLGNWLQWDVTCNNELVQGFQVEQKLDNYLLILAVWKTILRRSVHIPKSSVN